jgi:hypothetical protein
MVALMISSSVLLVAAAIAWRLAVKPTLQALVETGRPGREPTPCSRRMSELEEVRGLKDKLAAAGRQSLRWLPTPWRGRREGWSATGWNGTRCSKALAQILSGSTGRLLDRSSNGEASITAQALGLRRLGTHEKCASGSSVPGCAAQSHARVPPRPSTAIVMPRTIARARRARSLHAWTGPPRPEGAR